MSKVKKRLLKNIEKAVVNPKKTSDVEFEELEHKLQEDPRENDEGDIEEEEESGFEPYPEIEKELKKDDEEED